MRALVLYSAEGRLDALAADMAKGLERLGYRVQLLQADLGSSPIPMAQYDLICVGAASVGVFGGEIDAGMKTALKRSTRWQGKPAVAFVRRKLFGNGRSLRTLMASMEERGAWVQDFAALSGTADVEAFCRRLERLQRL